MNYILIEWLIEVWLGTAILVNLQKFLNRMTMGHKR